MKALLATYIKLNTPGVFCVEKARDMKSDGSSHAGSLLYSVKGGSRGNGETERCIREYTGRTGDSGRAGHGGIDSGMVGIEGLKEKGINLEIAIKLKAVLEKRGFTVMMTRGGR